MPQKNDGDSREDDNFEHTKQSTQRSKLAQARSAFALPTPIKRLFDATPLVTYAPNAKPRRRVESRHEHILHVFPEPTDAAEGHLSVNPSCLKWQTLLTLNGITFVLSPSTIHASPSGSLPYLETRWNNEEVILDHVIPASELPQFIRTYATKPVPSDIDNESRKYLTLLDTQVRIAYIYSLCTFEKVAVPLYVEPLSQNRGVRYCNAFTLRQAAMQEVLASINASSQTLQPQALLADAGQALSALSMCLKDADWFSIAILSKEQSSAQHQEASRPGYLDAAVFAYSHAILNLFKGAVSPLAAQLYSDLQNHTNLVAHHQRLLRMLT